MRYRLHNEFDFAHHEIELNGKNQYLQQKSVYENNPNQILITLFVIIERSTLTFSILKSAHIFPAHSSRFNFSIVYTRCFIYSRCSSHREHVLQTRKRCSHNDWNVTNSYIHNNKWLYENIILPPSHFPFINVQK